MWAEVINSLAPQYHIQEKKGKKITSKPKKKKRNKNKTNIVMPKAKKKKK